MVAYERLGVPNLTRDIGVDDKSFGLPGTEIGSPATDCLGFGAGKT
jgi:hypothetical protein